MVTSGTIPRPRARIQRQLHILQTNFPPSFDAELTTADPPKPTGLESTDILDGLLGPSRKPGALVGRRAAMTSPKTGAASSTSPSRGASRPGAQGPPPAARNAAPNTAASPSPTPAASTAPRDKDDSWDLDIDLPDSGPASPQRKTSPHRNAERDVAGPGPSAKRPPDNEVVGTGNKGTDALGAADFGIESEGEEGSDGDNDAVIKAGQSECMACLHDIVREDI